jgi:cell division protein FtsQ
VTPARKPTAKTRASASTRRRSATVPRRAARGGDRKRRSPKSRGRRARFEWSARRALVVAFASLMIGGMTFVFSRASIWGQSSERFVLSRFEVLGNGVLTDEEVLELANADVGANLFSIELRELEQALRSSPRVERARASRVLPDRIVVRLDERLPVALVDCGPGDVLEVAEDGTVFPPAARTALLDLPLITGAVRAIEPDGTGVCDELTPALDVLRRARHVSPALWMDISEVRIAPGSGLVIYTVADGAEIRVGSGAPDSQDLLRLWMVLSDLKGRGLVVASVDMRFSNQLVVELAKGARGCAPRRRDLS